MENHAGLWEQPKVASPTKIIKKKKTKLFYCYNQSLTTFFMSVANREVALWWINYYFSCFSS